MKRSDVLVVAEWLRRSMAVVTVAGILLCCAFSEGCWGGSLPSSGMVVAVFDGDTVLLDTGEKVRYLGIDAPEVRHKSEPGDCFGEEAKKANADWVLRKRVTLGYETEKVDSYGRLLALVFLPDGRCINAEMIGAGYAFVFRSSEPHSRLKELIGLQRGAIQSRRGMWGTCSPKPSLSYVGNSRNFVLHRAECGLGRKISRRNRVAFQTRRAGLEEGYRPARCCKP